MTSEEGRVVVVAIDGPSGVGKSTVSKLLATRLNADYIDTGAIYRAVALGAFRAKIAPDDDATLELFFNDIDLVFKEDRIFLNGIDLSADIRTEEAGGIASNYSSNPVLRARLLDMQRDFALRGSVVMEGRDIGTVVLPGAFRKFFLTASHEVRARRRFSDEKSTGRESINEISKAMSERDERDSKRKTAPLKPADDAIVIDTGSMSIEEVVETMLSSIREPLIYS